jgi:minor extracellular serine protease Vpr
VRRIAVILVVVTALVSSAVTASAALQPLRREVGGIAMPRLLRGRHVEIPAGHASGLVRVIVGLRLSPLAQAYGDGLGYRLGRRKLDAASSASKAYLARIEAAQERAIAEVKRAIPQARVSGRYRVVFDGFTVSVPVAKLPRLVGLGVVDHVYPSLRYTIDLNRSPSVIGATALQTATGASGNGIKIGVVDDGIDQTNRFFSPSGFSYPPGFPKGNTAFTTPKVIVARAFPGPGSGTAGTLPLDRQSSFHGTHVAGIAAGNANTTADPGRDHPQVTGLSGVAPRAWLGNYRVFNVPSPIGGGNFAETPEIMEAFESAVTDGMDVINFSGGGPETDPVNDAMIQTVKNVAAAGVVPVIAAGNDRDDFGLGTVGSPGTAPDAITVAAVSNSHVFGRELTVSSPPLAGSSSFPLVPSPDGIPGSWADANQTLVDVGTLRGQDGKPIERHLCGPTSNPNQLKATLPAGSLEGKVALVFRGRCTFVSKAYRVEAAGGAGMILVDNRAGDANPIPVALGIPGGMISNFDGTRLAAAMSKAGTTASFRVGREQLEIETNRQGVPTSFSSAGVTAFGHLLKPDVAAPGAQILSSTLAEFAGSPFAVFDGTSMATPHIAGSAALLLQRHPGWTPGQVKSALMSTAGPAFADPSRASEASVLLEGAGLAWLPAADQPLLFTSPQSLSFTDLDVRGGAQSGRLLLSVSDAGGGSGTWQVELRPQSATDGASLDVQPTFLLAPGGSTSLSITARAAAGAATGDDYGFVVLRRGSVTRRVPYEFSVVRPAIAAASPVPLKTLQSGDTRKGTNRVSVYRWPTEPFGPPPSFTGPPMDESGKEHVYVTTLAKNTVNFGVSVISQSNGALVEPWLLGSLDENTVQGYAGTPVNVNSIMFDFRFDIGAAGTVFAQPGKYYFSVDSQRDLFTHTSLAGSYVLRSWVNDVKPPRVELITTRVAAGRPTLVVRARDSQSGVDPFSIVFGYGNQLVAAAVFDPKTGVAIIPLPPQASALQAGKPKVLLIASDYQEAKNVNTIGPNALPNTIFKQATLSVVKGPTVAWVTPEAKSCAAKSSRLVVVAGDTASISSVSFFDGGQRIAVVKKGVAGIYGTTWKTAKAGRGNHTLRAIVQDKGGHQAGAARSVRVCA